MAYIGLLDCNNFFVSCERLFRPDLNKRPVAVLSSNDGCVVARSAEVKAMGVPMGMPVFQVKKLVDISDVTFFSSNFTLYRDISSRVMRVLEAAVGDCEVYSIDEAFFSLPASITLTELQELRSQIMQATGIPVSIGVGESKTLAKIGSELGKQGSGVTLLSKENKSALLKDYPCAKVWNVGAATAKKLKARHIETVGALLASNRHQLLDDFGVAGARIFDELSGQPVYPLLSNSKKLRQSCTSSRSFAEVVTKQLSLESAIVYHVEQVASKLRQLQLLTTELDILMKASRHSDFAHQTPTYRVTLAVPTNDTKLLTKAALSVLRQHFQTGLPYKKAGIVAKGLLLPNCVQASLLDPPASSTNRESLDSVLDSLRGKYGAQAVQAATSLAGGAQTSSLAKSPAYTTNWQAIPRVRA